MVHDYSTWLAGTRAMRWMRLGAPVGVLLACLLLAGMPALASAATPEMRGEWEIFVRGPVAEATGIALIKTEANSKGEFASSSAIFSNTYPSSFSGTLEGAKATITIITYALGPSPEVEVISKTMAVTSGGSKPSMSGSGEIFVNKAPGGVATIVATRIKTYKEVEEREAREAKEKKEKEEKEKKEKEELEAREKILGEWSLVIKVGPQAANGTALIKVTPGADDKFSSSSALFEGGVPGSFSGTVEGSTATVTVTTESTPAVEFIGEKLTVDTSGGSLSISGTGKLYANKGLVTESATLVATRTKTYAEVIAREAKEKLELETKEKEAKEKLELEAKEREAKAKAEQEAKAKAEQEAKAKAAFEAKAKAEQEAKEKQEREAREKLDKSALVSVRLAGKTFTVSPPGLLSMHLTNPNPYAISGRIVLIATQSAKAGKVSRARSGSGKKAQSLGTVSFEISPNGKQLVKVQLSRAGRAELARHKTLRVRATILTKANGQTSTTKTLTVTLHTGKAA
jgi:hypothetical protein